MISEQDIQSEVKFIQNTDAWPRWPMLPVKRSNGHKFPTCAILLDSKDYIKNNNNIVVYECNMYSASKEAIDKCVKHNYNSIEDMLKDGWMVD